MYFGFCGKRRGGGVSMFVVFEGWGRLGIMLLFEVVEKGCFLNVVVFLCGRMF